MAYQTGRWTVQDQRRGFSGGRFRGGGNMAELPVRPQQDQSAPQAPAPPQRPAGGGGGQWDSAWERRARKILGRRVGSAEDLQDPEHRKWINRKLRKHRARSTTQPQKPAQVVKPGQASTPEAPPIAPTQKTQGPIVKPGQIVKRALQPRMRGRVPGMPTRGAPRVDPRYRYASNA